MTASSSAPELSLSGGTTENNNDATTSNSNSIPTPTSGSTTTNPSIASLQTPPRSPSVVPRKSLTGDVNRGTQSPGTSSVPSSPRQRHHRQPSVGKSPSLSYKVPPPPPHSKLHDSSGYQPNTATTTTMMMMMGSGSPIASPSYSISSKTTIRTGSVGLRQHQPYTSSTTSSNMDQSSSGGVPSNPKARMSPTITSVKKNLDPSTMASSSSSSKPTTMQQPQEQQQQQPQQHQFFSKLDHPPLPLPRKASRCPLFCCFYAEFDIVAGPKICFESPLGFMEQSTDVSLHKIHKLLGRNFDRILSETGSVMKKKDSNPQQEQQQEQQQQQHQEPIDPAPPPVSSSDHPPAGESTNDEAEPNSTNQLDASNHDSKNKPSDTSLPSSPMTPMSPNHEVQSPSSQQPPIRGSKSGDSMGTLLVANTSTNNTGNNFNNNSNNNSNNNNTAGAFTININKQKGSVPDSIGGSTQHSMATASSGNTSNNAANANSKDTINATTTSSGSCTSIFDSTSDFIITGNELTGNIVNLSAFNMHLLTRPTIIHDQRYERNSLLFCVGFILRRTEDPRPFRPLLSKLALTLKRMEMESHFLSQPSSRQQIQPLLDRILVSLNCTHWETNLVVNNNVLNLKLFHPPKYPASPVPDHAVPILLRRDWQVQMYDWDLAINWVVLHIDGVANARQISKKAEVDMEMVRNCLRVLKHHGVIAIVDMFFYSNRYESTTRAAHMLAGNESSLLQEAAEYVIKRPQIHPGMNIQATAPTPYSHLVVAPLSPPIASPTLQEKFVHPPIMTGTSPASPITMHENVNANTISSTGLLGSSLKFNPAFASYQSQDPHLFGALRREEQRELKAALAELYCAFNRNLSFGDLWVELAAGGKPRSQSIDKSVERNNNRSGTNGGNESRFLYQQGNSGGGGTNNNNTNRTSSYTHGDSTEMSGSEGTREQGDGTDLSQKEYYFERLRQKTACASIEWSSMFDTFDHRRFISFGLVNGLLERVHNYPVLLDAGPGGQRKVYVSNDNWSSLDEASRIMAREISKMMNGTNCDDHIVSLFQQPINELIDLVEKCEGKKVLSMYSIATT